MSLRMDQITIIKISVPSFVCSFIHSFISTFVPVFFCQHTSTTIQISGKIKMNNSILSLNELIV